MWDPQSDDFSTWIKNEFKHLEEKHRESKKLFVYLDVHESKNNMPGEKLFSWCGEIDNNA